MSWVTAEFWRRRWRTPKPTQFFFIFPNIGKGEAPVGKGDWVNTCLCGWCKIKGFSLHNHGTLFEKLELLCRGGLHPAKLSKKSIQKHVKAHKSIVCAAVGQEWICLKATMEKLKLSHSSSPIQQLTETVPEQVRVPERVSGGRTAPSLLAATFSDTGWDLIFLPPGFLQLCFLWLRSQEPMWTAWTPTEVPTCRGSAQKDLV